MRVLHVSQGTTYGLARYLSQLATDQVARGWDVTLATPPDADLEAMCAKAGARYRSWPASRSPGPSVMTEVRRLRAIVRDADPEVVHLHSSKAGLAGRLAIRGKRPSVFTPHAWSFLHEGPTTRFLALRWERFATRWTSVTLCVSHGEQALGAAAGICTRWEVVPNAVDLSQFVAADDAERREQRRRLGVPGEQPAVVCVGRLVPQKGQDVLLSAWPAITSAHADAVLYLVGDGPERASLERAAPSGVHFVGEQDDVRGWLAAADVVVLPSRWEGLSLVSLEALACGSSIVATDVPGTRETLQPEGREGTGAVVAPEDAHALAAAINERLADPKLVAQERARARRLASDHDVAHWGAEIARVLTDAVQPSTRPGDARPPT